MSEQVRASHILLMYKGSERSTATRTKEQARQHIGQLLEESRQGSDFAELARANSDCPSGSDGGDLGKFRRGQMVPEFDASAFTLPVGGLSDVIETAFGYHLIRRTE